MKTIFQAIIALAGSYIGVEILTSPMQTWWSGVFTILLCILLENNYDVSKSNER